jgi:CubicO group peptidase (beta-lactamase class C family)
MPDTSFYVPQGKLERFGPLYSAPDANGLSVLDDVTTSPYVRPDVVPSGGAGLVSSMPDYLRFMLMLANGGELDGVRLLKRSTVTAMTTNQLVGPTFPVRFNNEPWAGMGYGLGVGVQVTEVPQFGWIGVSGTTAWIYPREEMIVIAMPQALFNWEASDTLLRMAHEALAI